VPGLDLAAMSTVCDIMPLVNENRVMVKYGLEKMRHDPRLGLKYMLQEASIKKQDLQTYHLGYILGPRLNAAGRIGDATDALRLLVTQKDRRAGTLAQLLGRLNKKRQDMTSDLLREVRSAIESEGTGKHLYFAYGDDWPEGIIGLVAGKIQDEFNHPVVLVSKSKKKSICRGSARSISGFSIIDAIEEFDDLLESFGSHDQAAGFSVAPEKIDDFKEKLQELAREKLEETNFVKEISADAKVDVSEMNWQYWQASKPLAPFGYSNRKPIFWISNAVIGSLKTVGDGKHLKLVLKGDGSGFLQCIYFGGGENIEKLAQGDIIDVIGSLGVNNWNGEQNLQFNIKDLHHNA
jgi:single-stranded-DNA-specific exonuclease